MKQQTKQQGAGDTASKLPPLTSSQILFALRYAAAYWLAENPLDLNAGMVRQAILESINRRLC